MRIDTVKGDQFNMWFHFQNTPSRTLRKSLKCPLFSSCATIKCRAHRQCLYGQPASGSLLDNCGRQSWTTWALRFVVYYAHQVKHILSSRCRYGIITCQIWYSDLFFLGHKRDLTLLLFTKVILWRTILCQTELGIELRGIFVWFISHQILHALSRTIRRETIEAPNN